MNPISHMIDLGLGWIIAFWVYAILMQVGILACVIKFLFFMKPERVIKEDINLHAVNFDNEISKKIKDELIKRGL